MTKKKKRGTVLTFTNNTGFPLIFMYASGQNPITVPPGRWRYEWERR